MISGRRTPQPVSSPSATYELTVSGTIGPVLRSCFREFATRELAAHTLITGRCVGSDQLQELLDLLSSNGFPATTVFIDRTTMARPTP